MAKVPRQGDPAPAGIGFGLGLQQIPRGVTRAVIDANHFVIHAQALAAAVNRWKLR